METKTLKPYFVVIALFVLTSLALAYTVDVTVTDRAGVRMDLPDRVAGWTGQDLRFCQNPVCQREFRVGDLAGATNCTACGASLDTMTKAERDALPPDTEIIKKEYRHTSGNVLYVTIVLSGKERASIHRPQACLVGQGNSILNSVIVPVPLEDRPPIEIMSLEMMRKIRAPDGRAMEIPTYFAYWFVGQGRETPYHIQRMVWMATDRVLHNVSHRWAYIGVSGSRRLDSDDYKQQLQAFVKDFYPHIVVQ